MGGGSPMVYAMMGVVLFAGLFIILPSAKHPSTPTVQFSTTSAETVQPYYGANGADVTLESQGQPQHSYDATNIGIGVAAAAGTAAGLAVCGDLTLGACDLEVGASAVGAVAGDLGLPVLSVSTTLTFENVGYATATGWTYTVVTLLNGAPLANQTFTLAPLQPGQSTTVQYSHDYTVGDIPGILWGTVTRQPSNVTFQVEGPYES